MRTDFCSLHTSGLFIIVLSYGADILGSLPKVLECQSISKLSEDEAMVDPTLCENVTQSNV